MKTADRVLGILRLFSVDRPEWTIEAAAQELGLSASTAHEYFRSLVHAGLLVAAKAGRYVIGPVIIEYDRLTRTCDPLIASAQPVMRKLTAGLGMPGVALLCRLYRLTVMCVDQHASPSTEFAVSYERGRPMSLFRGAASKIILSHMPRRTLRRNFEDFSAQIAETGMGRNWEEFRANLRRIRAIEVCITEGELDRGLIGISAPVFFPENEIVGSIGLVIATKSLARRPGVRELLASKVAAAGRQLSIAMSESSETAPKRRAAARESSPKVRMRRAG
jgi:DNA-binding IclR family transcriptional regulator